ncbi:MAG: ribonuclease E/G [Clostridia bacterium]|nr:ribonuclease E/G [Clostridia bacterium]
MIKNIYLDKNGGNYIAALAEGGKLLEYHIERDDDSNIVGNIYKGKVVNVLEGMQAAFVNVGLKKNAYLYVNELLPDKGDVVGSVDIPLTLNLKEGDEILVQVVKDYVGNKGVKCSPYLSFAGVYLVYMPSFDIVGVSRKIEDEAIRERLTATVEGFKRLGQGGFIVRTAAAKASKRELKKEAEELYSQYEATRRFAESISAPAQVHAEGDLITRMLRDVYSSDVAHIYFGNKTMYETVTSGKCLNEKTCENTGPCCNQALFGGNARRKEEYKKKAILFDRSTDMFKHFGLDREVDKLLRNRVELSSGAYLIIDKTEALTAIDVNTGKFTGKKNLEETVFQTNMLATAEIARQVRLRNIGGIVVVDFIDMEEEEHRTKVVEALENALKQDRSKCNVLGMSALGLVEFTRKKKRKESTSMLVQECPYCKGDGLVYSNDYVVQKLRIALLDLFAEGFSSAIIDLNADIADYIIKRNALSKDVSKIWSDKRIYIVPHRTYHLEEFSVRGDNSKVLDLPDNAKFLY